MLRNLQLPPAPTPAAAFAASLPARDQFLLNELLGNFAWLAGVMPPLVQRGERVLELGAGHGELGALLARPRRLSAYAGIDRRPRPADWPAPWEWWNLDALDFQHYDRFPIVVGNLFFHVLSADELAALGRVLRRSARVIVACEPARRRLHLLQVGLLGWLGLGAAARRWARAGIRAGFVADDLPRALGLPPRVWTWEISTGWNGAYRMIAQRRARPRDAA